MGLFKSSKPKPEPSDRHVSDALDGGGDGYYETEVVGEGKHRDHLAAVLKRHKRAAGWKDGRVAVPAYVIPLGVDGYGRYAVEVEGQRIGYVADNWVKAWGTIYERAASVLGKEVAYTCPAAICWSVSRGDPLRDPSVPLGVRLDLQDDEAIRSEMQRQR